MFVVLSTSKKVFQYVHKTCSALTNVAPETSVGLWLQCAATANTADQNEMVRYEYPSSGFYFDFGILQNIFYFGVQINTS